VLFPSLPTRWFEGILHLEVPQQSEGPRLCQRSGLENKRALLIKQIFSHELPRLDSANSPARPAALAPPGLGDLAVPARIRH
jgi:hypothetical protein